METSFEKEISMLLQMGPADKGPIVPTKEIKEMVHFPIAQFYVWDDIPGSEAPKYRITSKKVLNEIRRQDCSFLRDFYGEFRVVKEWEPAKDVLLYDDEENKFFSLLDMAAKRVYQYKTKHYRRYTIVIEGARSFIIQDSYNLDRIYEDMGGLHSHLRKVVEAKTGRNLLIWHERSTWSGSELDYGRIVTPEQALEEAKDHPEFKVISRWIKREGV